MQYRNPTLSPCNQKLCDALYARCRNQLVKQNWLAVGGLLFIEEIEQIISATYGFRVYRNMKVKHPIKLLVQLKNGDLTIRTIQYGSSSNS